MAESGIARSHMPAMNQAGIVQDFNPYLDDFKAQRRSQNAGAGQIYSGAERELIVWQTRPAVPSESSYSLAATLETIFAPRIYELPEIVAALNESGTPNPAGEAWTEQSFQAAFRDLGKLAF
jgi:hypothetical protein